MHHAQDEDKTAQLPRGRWFKTANKVGESPAAGIFL